MLFIYLITKIHIVQKGFGIIAWQKKRGGEHLGAHGLDTQLKICHI
jgi:hypothetical protein